MSNRRNTTWLILVFAALFLWCGSSGAYAQSDDPSLVWVGKQTKSKPQRVTPVRKPYHKTYKPQRPKPVVAPLLSLRWLLRTPGPDGKPMDMHPDHVFKIGDKLQLVIETNQAGFLYIVQEDDLSMIFPYPRFNAGKNDIQKEIPIVIPSNCPARNTDRNGNCYFDVTDSGSSLTIIFSRDQINGLPSEIDPSKGVIPISREDLRKLRGNIKQDYRKKDVANSNSVQFWNNNPDDNQDLIIDTRINYEKPERSN